MKSNYFDFRRIKATKIVVFGDFMVDEYLAGDVSRISPEAPVPVVHVQKRTQRLGGAGNVVRNLCALGAQVSALTLIGNDIAGQWLTVRLQEYGVSTADVFQSSDATTSIKTRVTARSQQLLRYDSEYVQSAPIVYQEYLKENLPRVLDGVQAVVISDYGKGVVTEQTAQLVIGEARKRGIIVTVDPKGSDYSKYRGATLCTPNMKELREAANAPVQSEDEIRAAALGICRSCDMTYVLATRSEKGMSLITSASEAKEDFPAMAKEVVDVTGAGDTVISVLTACMAAGARIQDACRISNLAASIVVSKFGASVATPGEIEALMNAERENRTGYNKILSAAEMQEKMKQLRATGRTVVFTNGCFDIVHAGHISSFRQARALGDVLVVGLNSDASIRRIKGEKRPIVDQNNRAALLAGLECVDYVVIFDDDTPEVLIQSLCPDVLVKGKDWMGKPVAGDAFLRSHGGRVEYIDLVAGLSTTTIIEKILNVYREETR